MCRQGCKLVTGVGGWAGTGPQKRQSKWCWPRGHQNGVRYVIAFSPSRSNLMVAGVCGDCLLIRLDRMQGQDVALKGEIDGKNWAD